MKAEYDIVRGDRRRLTTLASTELDDESTEQWLVVATLTRFINRAKGNGGTYSIPQQRHTHYSSFHCLIALECKRAAQSAHATSEGQILHLYKQFYQGSEA